ncbi:MAG: stage II sporulation protein P, partial [Clostridia bacterium]|nr:stage II sporulation protein P [Clostridia bacterium]
LMVVLGSSFDHWQEGLGLALKLCAQLERQHPGITRPIQLRRATFNQDLVPGSLLIEVGAAGNTRAEALRAAEELAGAIIALAGGTA